jgi:hypothetical protein
VPLGPLQYLVNAPKLDHLFVQSAGPGAPRLFVSVKQNYTVAVFSLAVPTAPVLTKVITGVAAPQGLAVSYPRGAHGVLFVSGDDDGSVHAFDLLTLAPLWTTTVGAGADNVKLDEAAGLVWVAFDLVPGPGSGLQSLNMLTGAKVGFISLPEHPEEFSVDPNSNRIVGTAPDAADLIYLADRSTKKLTAQYRLPGVCVYPKANTPDWVNSRMLISCEGISSGSGGKTQVPSGNPAFVVLDINTGSVIWSTRINYVCNSVEYDAGSGDIILSCGGRANQPYRSSILLLEQSFAADGVTDSYAVVGSVPLPSTGVVNARTAAYNPRTQVLYVGQPFDNANQQGAVLIFAPVAAAAGVSACVVPPAGLSAGAGVGIGIAIGLFLSAAGAGALFAIKGGGGGGGARKGANLARVVSYNPVAKV